jgi:hypothetical protein
MFCDEQGPLTREHAWPAWLRDALTPRGPFKATVAGRQWQAPSVDVVVRAVCGGCNNGWLAQIEAATLPVLRQLVTGEVAPTGPVALDESAQSLLATWAAKTVLTHEPIRPIRVIPDGEFWTFHKHRRPVGSQFIFLSAYAGRRWAARTWREPLYRTGRDGHRLSQHPVGYTATLLAGRALFRIVRCEPAGTPMWIENSLASRSVRLWPPSAEPQLWPPPLAVDDHAVDAFGASTSTA